MLDPALLEQTGHIGKKTQAVYDYQFIQRLKQVSWQVWYEQDPPMQCRNEYLEAIEAWIKSSQLNKIHGLNAYSRKDLICGTTQTFDEAYFKYSERRLRLFRGEYAYHARIFKNWAFLDDEPLVEGDFIILSLPFCSTGDVHPQTKWVLDQASALRVPVILDCAYFGTCKDIEFDVSHPAIESVSFSLTKGLGLGDIRSGVRFSNLDDNNPICQQNNYNHTVLSSAKIGLYMMNQFSPDFIPSKYAKAQVSACEDLGLAPTKCMHLALAPENETWSKYIIDGKYRRVGIRNLVKARFKGEV